MNAKKVPKPIKELWAEVADSFEEAQDKIRKALKATMVFGTVENEWDIHLEATFPDYIIVSVYSSTGANKYYRAAWEEADDGGITFDNVKVVRAQTVIKAMSEEAKVIQEMRGEHDLSETFITPITLTLDEAASAKAGKDVFVGRVKTAQ